MSGMNASKVDESIEDDERSGRPSTSKTDENINKVREMLINNRKLTIRELALKHCL